MRMNKTNLVRAVAMSGLFFAVAATAAPAAKENGKLERKASSDALENQFLKATVSAWEGKWVLSRLLYKPDGAEIVRYLNGTRFQDGLQWAQWPGNAGELKYQSSPLGDNAVGISREKDHVTMVDKLSMPGDGSLLRFDVRIENKGDKELSDQYFNHVSLCAGRLEKECNPKAFLFVPKKGGGFDGKQVVSLWGGYKHAPFAPTLGLLDKEDKLMFIQSVTKGTVKSHTFSVGAADSHGGRDVGKRSVAGLTLAPFKLAPGKAVEYQYEWALVKGLSGLSGYADGLAVNARMASPTEARLEFASAIPVKKTLAATLTVKDADGKEVERLSHDYVLDLAPGVPREEPVVLKPAAGKLSVEVTFHADDKELGRRTMELPGPDGAALEAALASARKQLQSAVDAVPYLGAEYPGTLKQTVLASYYGEKMEAALQDGDTGKARQLLGDLEKCVREAKAKAAEETAKPCSPALRALSDRERRAECYVKGSDIYSPEGHRLFLQGIMDGLGDLKWEYDPKGEFTRQTPILDLLKSPRWRSLAIERMVKEARSYGNLVSLYVEWNGSNKDIPHAEYLKWYLPFIDEVMEALHKEHIWVTLFLNGGGWEDYFNPERRSQWLEGWKYVSSKYGHYDNITHYVVTSPEPLPPRAKEKITRERWTAHIIGKYGSLEAADKALAASGDGFAGTEKAERLLLPPSYLDDEGKFSARTKDYEEFLSSVMGLMTEEMIQAIRSTGDTHPIFLGTSVWACWPLNLTTWIGNYAADPRVAGLCLDKYVGGWWGGVNNPPEICWDSFHAYGVKPLVIGEWGTGCAMDFDTGWSRAFDSTRQSWGRLFAGLKAKSMVAWCGGGAPWANMFDFKTKQPLPVTKELVDIKDELIANPLPQDVQVLVVGNRNLPTYVFVSMARLAAYFPQVKVDFSQGDTADLKRWDLSPYKLVICYTEGTSAKDIAALRDFKGKVLLLGRPNLPPDQPGADDWRDAGLFVKGEVECQGRGATSPAAVKLLRDVGGLKAGSSFKHVFARNKCAWVPKASLRDDVEVLAESDGDAVLARQGNIYWWTDMLGIETLDLPTSAAPPYPQLRESERNLLNALFDEAGVKYEVSPLQVWVSNDIAYSYETATGWVKVHNAGTVQLPEGMTLSSYERFKDGIGMVVTGKGGAQLVARCNADQVAKVVLNGKDAEFGRLDARHVSLKLPKDANNQYNIEVRFK